MDYFNLPSDLFMGESFSPPKKNRLIRKLDRDSGPMPEAYKSKYYSEGPLVIPEGIEENYKEFNAVNDNLISRLAYLNGRRTYLEYLIKPWTDLIPIYAGIRRNQIKKERDNIRKELDVLEKEIATIKEKFPQILTHVYAGTKVSGLIDTPSAPTPSEPIYLQRIQGAHEIQKNKNIRKKRKKV